jgi:hypothetical protein
MREHQELHTKREPISSRPPSHPELWVVPRAPVNDFGHQPQGRGVGPLLEVAEGRVVQQLGLWVWFNLVGCTAVLMPDVAA